jgi:hypothetical protein
MTFGVEEVGAGNSTGKFAKNSSIDRIVQHEYFEIILGKVLFSTVTNRK